jgi:hypothetical protein
LEQKDKDEGDKARLDIEDFEQVYEMTSAFKEYLQSVSGLNESERARVELARNDGFQDV